MISSKRSKHKTLILFSQFLFENCYFIVLESNVVMSVLHHMKLVSVDTNRTKRKQETFPCARYCHTHAALFLAGKEKLGRRRAHDMHVKISGKCEGGGNKDDIL